jgi:transcription initiation factor TFIIIB Brf1 subunit/transcription initiation factor TFIIB
MPNFVSRCLQLLAVVGVTRATASAMEFDAPDLVAPFVSSLKVNDQIATSITQILKDSASAQNDTASRAFSTAGIACAISKLVFGESTLLDQTAIEPVVEKSW